MTRDSDIPTYEELDGTESCDYFMKAFVLILVIVVIKVPFSYSLSLN